MRHLVLTDCTHSCHLSIISVSSLENNPLPKRDFPYIQNEIKSSSLPLYLFIEALIKINKSIFHDLLNTVLRDDIVILILSVYFYAYKAIMILVLPLTDCVTMGKLLKSCVLQFPHSYNTDINNSFEELEEYCENQMS